MPKALIVATVSGFVPQFEGNHIRLLQKLGYEVHYASNFNHPWYGTDNRRLLEFELQLHQVDFERSPCCVKQNWKAYRQLNTIISTGQYDLIHCHTPVAAALSRIAARKKRETGTKVIYTAHGFHFYQGAPWKNWLLFYPAEYILAAWTDVLITINQEDYKRAKTFPVNQVIQIPGPGLKKESFSVPEKSKEELRTLFKIPQEAFFVLMVGELNEHKNHEIIINAAALLRKKNFIFGICGEGALRDRLEKKVRDCGLEQQFRFFGYCENIKWFYDAADCFLFPSVREGLGMAALEAMAAGLPLITSDCRGTREYMQDEITGFVCRENTPQAYARLLCRMFEEKEKRRQMGVCAKAAAKRFRAEQTEQIMEQLYSQFAHNRQ